MSTTTDRLPMRPRGAARHAANAPAGVEPLPTRRARRAAERAAADPTTAPGTGTGATPLRDAAPSIETPGTDVPGTASLRHPDLPAASPAPTPPASEPSTPPAARPRARRAASALPAVPVVSPTVTTGAVTHSTTGAAVSPPAAPVSTSAGNPQPLPSRRTLRTETPAIRPTALGHAVTQAITLPLRSIGSAFASARAVPLTATAVAACLFVTVATPQTATAASATSVLPALDVQEYTTSATSTARAERDGFAIGRAPERRAAAAPSSEPAPGASAARPVAGTTPAAGGFGSRWVSGCGACSTNHQGLDFAAREGTAVVAAMSGRVVSAGVVGGYGNQVLLQHADGSQTRYGHLSQIGVRVGQTVTAGQRIGAVGNTGVSTGSHLHFEVLHGGVAVDPAVWLRDRGLL
ncbi:M23 family metallopeptidase [Curtobacterium sp. C2H10]|uniref:M23 family metallopeptidase n=1 Tax=Curtobacterium sp. C2H10 TaxID=2736664 RepID=UPI0021C0B0DB|nr:M23 family metallopeptidase [Curtobacterium sp. C2H10]MCT9622479.1 M23 family metallopeptidase [Curtobacterium sp. C2H10]